MTYSKLQRVKYKDLAGILVVGDQDVTIQGFDLTKHMHRAAWLATMLESPKWGTVQSYDNAGISGGPFHWIARYPRTGEQGSLFGLLRRIEMVGVTGGALKNLLEAFRSCGWYLSQDGKLKLVATGAVVSGNAIRDEIAPLKGVVPDKGPHRDRAEWWALLFHHLFALSWTWPAQIDFAVSHLVRGQKDLEVGVYSALLGKSIVTPEVVGGVDSISAQSDLAMSVYHAFSVNAPSPAASCLQSVRKYAGDVSFPARLIKALGTKKYGAWDKRYARTRSFAKEMWPDSYEIMPAKFGGA